jgi:hypothetical protein
VHAVHQFERSRSPLTAAEFRAVQDQEFGDDVERARLRHPHLEIKITDPDTGATVPPGTTGEQCTRGYASSSPGTRRLHS